MQIRLSAAQIWLASEPVDFRKAITGLSEIVQNHYQQHLKDSLYVFYNRAGNRLKCLGCHRNGMVLIYKVLDKKRFYIKSGVPNLTALNEETFSWLFAGLDWETMSTCQELTYPDYF
jgi:transposase